MADEAAAAAASVKAQGNKLRKLLLHKHAIFAYAGITVILLIILLIFLILRPSKPSFTLQDAKLYTFNMSTPAPTLTSNFQVTIASKNPNNRIGIFYDKVSVYASYRNQQITLPTIIPPTYQGHRDEVVWSPYVYGTDVPLAPIVALALGQDEVAGMALVDVKVSCRVRWKVGSFVSVGYRMNVNCPAYVTFMGGAAVKYPFDQGCHVEV